MKETNETSYPDLMKMNPNEVNYKGKMEEIKRTLTCAERTKYRLFSLDNNYCLYLASMWFESIEDFSHLEQATPRALNNISKFHYNPISLTEQTRPLFDNLQALYLYSPQDNQFPEDERIKARKIQISPYYHTGAEK